MAGAVYNEADLAYAMDEWGMDKNNALAKHQAGVWLQHCIEEKYFAKGYFIRSTHLGVEGVYVVASCAESSRRMTEHYRHIGKGMMVYNPDWTLYDVFFYPGLCMYNFRGLTQQPPVLVG